MFGKDKDKKKKSKNYEAEEEDDPNQAEEDDVEENDEEEETNEENSRPAQRIIKNMQQQNKIPQQPTQVMLRYFSDADFANVILQEIKVLNDKVDLILSKC